MPIIAARLKCWVLLINLGQEAFAIARGERIAQMVFQIVPDTDLVQGTGAIRDRFVVQVALVIPVRNKRLC